MIITSMLQLRNQIVFFTNVINSYQNITSPDTINTGGHTVNTWTGLLIDLIYNFDITNRI